MKIERFDIEGPLLILPERIADDRGFFSETFRRDVLMHHGIEREFVQENHSLSRRVGTVRGLHFQIPPRAQDKLVRVVRGAILDVVVDIRHGSPTFGRHLAVELSAENWRQLLVPAGFAHGFCTLLPDTEVVYKVTDYHAPECERGLAWDDPVLAIDWPVDPQDAVLSERDRRHPPLSGLPEYFTGTGRDRAGRKA